MFPGLAKEWKLQMNALEGWKTFGAPDWRRLAQSFGVSWVVLEKPRKTDLVCPYQNADLLVCQLGSDAVHLVSR
jgi:hypothetical protein